MADHLVNHLDVLDDLLIKRLDDLLIT